MNPRFFKDQQYGFFFCGLVFLFDLAGFNLESHPVHTDFTVAKL